MQSSYSTKQCYEQNNILIPIYFFKNRIQVPVSCTRTCREFSHLLKSIAYFTINFIVASVSDIRETKKKFKVIHRLPIEELKVKFYRLMKCIDLCFQEFSYQQPNTATCQMAEWLKFYVAVESHVKFIDWYYWKIPDHDRQWWFSK